MKKERWQEAFPNATEETYLRFVQQWNIECADQQVQQLVEGYDRAFNQAFVGSLGRKGNMPIIYQWTGEEIEPFSIDFVVPRLDRGLVDLLTQRINGTFSGPAWASVFQIEQRIHRLRGRLIYWHRRPL
jgi:hypothetical protein